MASFNNELSFRNELNAIWQRKWWVVGITVAAAVAGMLISSPTFMAPEYSSSAELLPPSLQELRSLNYRPAVYDGTGIAEDEDLERISEVLSSDTLMYILEKKFDLLKRYGLDGIDDPVRRAKKFRSAYQRHVDVSITSFSTVRAQVEDEDPMVAYKMAQEMVVYVDSFLESLVLRKKSIAAIEKQVAVLDAQIQALRDTLTKVRLKFHVYNISSLSDPTGATLNPYFMGPEFSKYYDWALHTEQTSFQLLKIRAEAMDELSFRKRELEMTPSYLTVVGPPTLNLDPVNPNRVLITLLSALGGLLFSIFLTVLLHKTVGLTPETAPSVPERVAERV